LAVGSRLVVATVTGRSLRVAAVAVTVIAFAAGSVWAVRINGTAGNDTLRGGARADTLDGKGGDDRLFGAGGNDVLVGGRGNDLLVGGIGADTFRCGPGRDTATRDKRDTVARDCEVVRGPKPAPPPPPTSPAPPPPAPPAPPAPGAPANYAFGPEVTPTQQAAARDALDMAARFYRTAFGREVPPFNVWGFRDLEALARLYLERSGEVTSLEQARAQWGSLIAHAGSSGLWIGPLWFSTDTVNGTKILAKEEFILLLYGIAGPRSLNSGQDDIPRAGPRWLSEGTGELAAYLVIDDARLANMASVRANWVQRAKASPVTLERLAILRGQFEAGSNAWAIMPLAVERLVGEGGAAKAVSYFERIGRGEPWDAAFASAFGKSPGAFYAEFEAYRRGL
jgi:RTX calcium-binding nonapeptide repeat (4 copies)